jgi:hypothetical protein
MSRTPVWFTFDGLARMHQESMGKTRCCPMVELVVRDLDPALVAKLKQRADMHCRSVEEEHEAILRDVL